MSISDQEGPLELEVSNFGPIVEAKVDLRPFTLFVGPSNTGKSYLAILIYALHRLFSGFASNPYHRRLSFRRFRPYMRRHVQKDQKLSKVAIENLYDWVHLVLLGIETASDPSRDRYPLLEEIAALIRPQLESVAGSSEEFEAEITRCFGLWSTKQLIRSLGATASQAILRRYIGAKEECENSFVRKLDIPTYRGEDRLVFPLRFLQTSRYAF